MVATCLLMNLLELISRVTSQVVVMQSGVTVFHTKYQNVTPSHLDLQSDICIIPSGVDTATRYSGLQPPQFRWWAVFLHCMGKE